MKAIKRYVLSLALVAGVVVGLVVAAASPSMAQTVPTYTYSSPAQHLWAANYLQGCEDRFIVLNPSSSSVTFTVKEFRNNVVAYESTRTVAPGAVSTGYLRHVGTNAYTRLEITSTSGRLIPSAHMACTSGLTTDKYAFDGSEWTVSNPNGGASENLQRVNSLLDATAAKLDAANAKLDAVNGKLDAVNGKLDAIAARNGNRTTWTCAGGSVRNQPANRSQMYLTLWNPSPIGLPVPVTVTYSTTRGNVQRTYGATSQPVQIDVNQALVGAAGAFPLATDVDTAITAQSASPIRIECAVFFSRTVGTVGPVTGVQDLPVTSN